jgi:hypothetical protein
MGNVQSRSRRQRSSRKTRRRERSESRHSYNETSLCTDCREGLIEANFGHLAIQDQQEAADRLENEEDDTRVRQGSRRRSPRSDRPHRRRHHRRRRRGHGNGRRTRRHRGRDDAHLPHNSTTRDVNEEIYVYQRGPHGPKLQHHLRSI